MNPTLLDTALPVREGTASRTESGARSGATSAGFRDSLATLLEALAGVEHGSAQAVPDDAVPRPPEAELPDEARAVEGGAEDATLEALLASIAPPEASPKRSARELPAPAIARAGPPPASSPATQESGVEARPGVAPQLAPAAEAPVSPSAEEAGGPRRLSAPEARAELRPPATAAEARNAAEVVSASRPAVEAASRPSPETVPDEIASRPRAAAGSTASDASSEREPRGRERASAARPAVPPDTSPPSPADAVSREAPGAPPSPGEETPPPGLGASAVRLAAAGPAAGAPPAPPAAPVEALPTHVEWLAARGGGSARVQLHPPHLGSVDLSVRLRGNRVEVSIVSPSAEARGLVEGAQQLLGEALASRELRLDQLHVAGPERESPAGAGPDPHARDTDSRQPRDAEERLPGRRAPERGGEEPTREGRTTARTVPTSAAPGRIDLHA